MKNILLLFLAIACCSSCTKEAKINIEFEKELVGDWFRSHPINVWGGHGEPNFERGERRYTMTFKEDGSFILDTRTFGLYEGTTLDDLNGFKTEYGSYTLDGNIVDIRLTHYEWFDTWYPDMTESETITLESGFKWRFLDATGEIEEDQLTFKYHQTTDIIDPSSETPGIDLYVEEYTRVE